MMSSMISRDKLSHAYIICGERGVGKKTLARYFAAQILCERQSGTPCGECKSCRMLSHDAHPDFITVKANGKSGNYLAADLRAIISDTSVSPNEGEKKIYFLPRIDKALPAAQNVLLKIVEEPPQHVIFIMTAESKESILPTILSRTIVINISETSEAECLEALLAEGVSQSDAQKAVSLYRGNIGRCLEYLNSDEAKLLPDTVRIITEALISKDEYALLKTLTSLDSDRDFCLDVLASLKTVIRDAQVQKFGGELYSLCRDEVSEFSKVFRKSALERMYDELTTAENKIKGNAFATLVLSDLCGRII